MNVNEKLLADLLEKMIDSQAASSQAVTQLRDTLTDTCSAVKELNRHFSNGFKAEIKQHITTGFDEFRESIQAVDEKVEEVRSKRFWATFVGTTVVVVGGIMTAAGAIVSAKVDDSLQRYFRSQPAIVSPAPGATSRPSGSSSSATGSVPFVLGKVQ